MSSLPFGKIVRGGPLPGPRAGEYLGRRQPEVGQRKRCPEDQREEVVVESEAHVSRGFTKPWVG